MAAFPYENNNFMDIIIILNSQDFLYNVCMLKLPSCKLDVKLIAFDLDDTLLNDERVITEDTIKYIRKCAERGIYIVLCSGRVENAILPYVRTLDIAGMESGRYLIGINGASIMDLHTRQPVFTQKLDGIILNKVFEEASARGLGCHVCDADTIYADRDTDWTRKDAIMCGINFRKIENFAEFLNKGHPKILVPGPEEEIALFLPQLKELLKGKADVFTSKPFFLEVMPLDCGKGQSILKLAEILNIPQEQTMGFGDSFNDESMIRLTGHGVCMCNGREEIKQIARYVTRFSNNEDGIADFLNEFVL